MHPDFPGYIDELHDHFRSILVEKLDPAQLQLHDYYSLQDPSYTGDDCLEEFPLVDGLPELLECEAPEILEDMDDDEIDELAYIATDYGEDDEDDET